MSGVHNPLASILMSEKLNGSENFFDWYRTLKIILTCERIAYVLDSPLPKSFLDNASEEEREIFKKWKEDEERARCYMLVGMSKELQRQHEKLDA